MLYDKLPVIAIHILTMDTRARENSSVECISVFGQEDSRLELSLNSFTKYITHSVGYRSRVQ